MHGMLQVYRDHEAFVLVFSRYVVHTLSSNCAAFEIDIEIPEVGAPVSIFFAAC